MLSYLRAKFEAPSATMARLFDYVFPAEAVRQAALCWSRCDLFLMVFSPGVYSDPVKIAMLLPGQSGGKRLRHTPFLLWSNISLQFTTQTDVMAVFLADNRNPPNVLVAFQALKDTLLTAVGAASSQVVPAHL